MGQRWVEFGNGRGKSSAIDDFEIEVHGEALDVGKLDRERVRDAAAHVTARAELVRASVAQVTRVTVLEGEAHTTARADIIASASVATGQGGATGRTFTADGVRCIARSHAGCVVVCGANETVPQAALDTLPPNVALAVFGAAINVGRIKREAIPFADWRNGEVCEAEIDGHDVMLRRAGYRIQVWGREDRELPYAARRAPAQLTGTMDDYEVVAEGRALHIGRIDRQVIERTGTLHDNHRHGVLREALANINADRELDGWRGRRKIDDIDCSIRRDGWRFTVWGAGESEPPVNYRDMPPGGDLPGAEVPAVRITIAPFTLDGTSLKPAPPATPELAAHRKSLLEQQSRAEADGNAAEANRLKAEFLATYPR